MTRINSVDTIRGLSLFFMIYGHMILFWLRPEDQWLKYWLYAFLKPMGATGFLFISGASATLAFKNNEHTKKVPMTTMRNIYLLRGVFILLIGFIFNLGVALMFEGGNLAFIWSWNALQTIAISLLLLLPLLKTSKTSRTLLAISVIILNQILLNILTPYNGQDSILGFLNHLLFNPSDQYIILNYFGITLIGSVIGNIVFDLSKIENQEKRAFLFNDKSIIYTFFIGIFILVFGVWFQFPNFLIFSTVSSVVYSIGLIIALLTILIVIEVLEVFKTKKSYKYLFFYSYYSFTLFLTHNLLLLLFFQQLNAYFTIWIVLVFFIIVLGYLLRIMYHKLGMYASLKAAISILSAFIVIKLEKRNVRAILTE
ncbi:MAG: heparan-alpha-glucosaminide N-acetyltransferase domain-containing protein [Promethearchaeota archaeon]